MSRKLGFVLSAVMLLALAASSLAGATKATDPAGTLAKKGTKITKTGTNVFLRSNVLGKIGCATLDVNGELIKNDGSTVEGRAGNQKPAQTGCVGEEGVPVTVTRLEVPLIIGSSGTSDTGMTSFEAEVDVGEKVCHFKGTNVKGTIPTTGSNVIEFTNSSGVTSSTGCGSATLTGKFKLETTGTTSPIILSS